MKVRKSIDKIFGIAMTMAGPISAYKSCMQHMPTHSRDNKLKKPNLEHRTIADVECVVERVNDHTEQREYDMQHNEPHLSNVQEERPLAQLHPDRSRPCVRVRACARARACVRTHTSASMNEHMRACLCG